MSELPQPSEERRSEVLDIIETESYWGIFGRLGCHDIVSPPVARPQVSEGRRQRIMRAYFDEDGNWTVSIDPVTPADATE